MAEHSPIDLELIIPRTAEVARRMQGFFERIGWEVTSTDEEFMSYVTPHMDDRNAPKVGYWQTENPEKVRRFVDNPTHDPSKYACGLWLPERQDLVEFSLNLPTNDTVQRLFDQGGNILEAHTYTLLREHDGRQEFRFTDPFNYAFRVTTHEKLGSLGSVSVDQWDFRAYWDTSAGGTHAWKRLRRVIANYPDFPMQFDGTDPDNETFVGDLGAAVAWLDGHKPHKKQIYTKVLEQTLTSHLELAELRKTQPEPYAMQREDLTDEVWRDIVELYHEVAYDYRFSDDDIDSRAYNSPNKSESFGEFRFGSRFTLHSKLYIAHKGPGLVGFRFDLNMSQREIWGGGPKLRDTEITELTFNRRVAEYLESKGLHRSLESQIN